MNEATPAGAPGAHVVIAELEVKPDRLTDFVALARAFAAECLAREPGCLEFQIVRLDSTSSAAPHVLFFEAYDDAAAFDAHCASAHLVRFKAAFQAMVSSEQPLRQGRRVQEVA